MSFGGNMGPSGALIPFGIVKNILGEQATGYDAAGNIKFVTSSGRVYTPDRVDTLVLLGFAVDVSPPLAAVVPGTPSPANADQGILVTAVPLANQHGLPKNFGPGRGNWADPTGRFPRLRLLASAAMNSPIAGGGIASMFFALMPGDNAATIAQGSPVLFPQDGATSGAGAPVRTGPGTFQIVTPGLYRISWQASIAEAAQLMIRRNAALVASTVASRAATSSDQVSNSVLLSCAAGDIIEVINPPGNATALTMVPADGNLTHPVGATLVFDLVGGGTSTGGVDVTSLAAVGGADVVGAVRNYNGIDLTSLFLTVECVHSVQG